VCLDSISSICTIACLYKYLTRSDRSFGKSKKKQKQRRLASPQRGERLGSSAARCPLASERGVSSGYGLAHWFACSVKKNDRPAPRSSAEIVWGGASPALTRSLAGAKARRASGLQRPDRFRVKVKKKGDVHCNYSTQYTPHPVPKKRDKLLCPFRVAVALPCVSGVVYLCRDTFFVGFSAATACYHCVHVASFLHDFDRFSYSLSTASC
jgi:hypothetical protein